MKANGDDHGSHSEEGTVFKITPSGTLTTLYLFCSQNDCADGSGAHELVQAANGNFYGATTFLGPYDGGIVFRLTEGLGRFVETHLTSGKVGATIKILGTNLVNVSGIGFNGTAAVFAVVLNAEITARVPAGARSGKVEVVALTATLSSNLPFRVLP